MAAKWNKEGLTDEQLKELEPLMKRASIFKAKIDEKNRLMMLDIGMNFDRKNEIRRQKAELEKNLNKLTSQIEDIYTAQEQYEQYLEVAGQSITKAEELKEKYKLKLNSEKVDLILDKCNLRFS